MRRLGQAVLVVAIGLAGWLAWQFFFPNHERQIRELLGQAASAASWTESTPPLDKLTGAGRVAAFCSPDVVVRLDLEGARQLSGRAAVREAGAVARSQLGAMVVKVGECEVRVDPGAQTAVAQAVIIILQFSGTTDPWVNEVRIRLAREGRAWRISRIEPVRGFGG